MATKDSSATETLRNHSAGLIAYAQNLREAAALALQKSSVPSLTRWRKVEMKQPAWQPLWLLRRSD